MIYLIPFIAAIIGWITNKVAIKMLFHPRLPVTFAGITVQGVFPKRQQHFAQKLGQLVSKELLSLSEIQAKITSPANVHRVMPIIEKHIDHFLQVKIADKIPMVSMFLGDSTKAQLKGILMEELQTLFPELMDAYANGLQDDINIEALVTEKVAAFSSDKLEEILYSIMAKEFVFIEVIGAVLGFIIGLIQLGLSLVSFG